MNSISRNTQSGHRLTNHRFLTPDQNVQQTAFANGVTVTVNFGPTTFTLTDGSVMEPKGFQVK